MKKEYFKIATLIITIILYVVTIKIIRIYQRLVGNDAHLVLCIKDVKKITTHVYGANIKYKVITEPKHINKIIGILKNNTHSRFMTFPVKYTMVIECENDTIKVLFNEKSLKAGDKDYICDYDLEKLIYDN